MMKLFKDNGQREQTLSEFKNPFKSDSVEEIEIKITRGWLATPLSPIQHFAYVKFRNGNTSGRQRIEAQDFVSLIKKIEAFIKSL